MTDKAPSSDFNFAPADQEIAPFDVNTLLQEYADGRRKFNQIDLKNGNLSHANLPYLQLEESLLQKIDLRHAILAGASLNHTDLSSANLARVNLIAADLIRTKLAGANLTGAFLSGANLSGANLRKSNLTDCTLAGANLSGVDFTGATFRNTNLAGATLRGANLSEADLSDLDLTELNLEGSILPADPGGSAWAALQPGPTFDDSEAVTAPDSGQDSPAEANSSDPAEAYPLDAFDDSYEALIQDLAEGAPWSEGISASSSSQVASDRAHAPSGEEFLPRSPFEHHEDTSPVLNSMALVPVPENGTFPTGKVNPAVDQDEDAPADTSPENSTETVIELFPPAGEEPEPAIELSAPSEGEIEFPGDASSDQDILNTAYQLGDYVQAAAPSEVLDHGATDSDTRADFHPLPVDLDQATIPAPAVGPNALPSPVDESTVEKKLSQKIDPDNRQGHHQEEVIKTIQSALNRRTHYSLRRKLLEIYGKRCAITGCPIRPLLDTALIDASGSTVIDHPSNGLVLRTDIKILYNLFLIAIHPTEQTVMLAPSLRQSSYGYLNGRKIILPKQKIYHPGRAYLQAHLEQCKWLQYPSEESYLSESRLKPAETFETITTGSESTLLPKLAMVAGSFLAGGLLASLLWTLLPIGAIPNLIDSGSQPAESADQAEEAAIPTVTVDPENIIRLQMGPLVYPFGGVIFDESSYLSWAQLEEAGLIDDLADSATIIQAFGQRFVKASDISSLGLDVTWDAEARTVALNCCSDPEIEPINITVDGQNISTDGLIINGSSYAPAQVFEPLNMAPVQVPGEYFVGVDQQFYVKSRGLKDVGLDVTWEPATRTLNLGE